MGHPLGIVFFNCGSIPDRTSSIGGLINAATVSVVTDICYSISDQRWALEKTLRQTGRESEQKGGRALCPVSELL